MLPPCFAWPGLAELNAGAIDCSLKVMGGPVFSGVVPEEWELSIQAAIPRKAVQPACSAYRASISELSPGNCSRALLAHLPDRARDREKSLDAFVSSPLTYSKLASRAKQWTFSSSSSEGFSYLHSLCDSWTPHRSPYSSWFLVPRTGHNQGVTSEEGQHGWVYFLLLLLTVSQ